MKKYIQKNWLLYLPLAVLMLLVSACKKEGKEKDLPTGETSISLSVFTPENNQPQKFNQLDDIELSKRINIDFVNQEDFAVRTTFEEVQEEPFRQTDTANDATAYVEKLKKKYRVLLYNIGERTPIANIVVSPNEKQDFMVKPNMKYKMVVFSTNEDQVPDIQKSNNNIAAEDIANKEVLYYSKDIETKPGANHIKVALKRMTSKIDLKIDVRGLFGGIHKTSKIDIGYGHGYNYKSLIQTASFNLFDSTFGTTKAVDVKSFDQVQFTTEINSELGPQLGVLSFNTVSTITVPRNQLNIRLNTLDIVRRITQDHGKDQPGLIKKTKSDLIFKNSKAIKLQPGVKYNAMIELMNKKIEFGSVIWAPGNLIYEPEVSRDYPYRILDDNNARPSDRIIRKTYWNFKARTIEVKARVNEIDPCSLVFPAGTWRMPTRKEFQPLLDDMPYNLANDATDKNYRANGNADIRYVWNKNTPTELQIRMYGFRKTDGNYSEVPNTNQSAHAEYWTTESSSTSRGYNIEGKRRFNRPGKPTITTGNKREGRNIRCVRDKK